jgi:hypothetical protein
VLDILSAAAYCILFIKSHILLLVLCVTILVLAVACSHEWPPWQLGLLKLLTKHTVFNDEAQELCDATMIVFWRMVPQHAHGEARNQQALVCCTYCRHQFRVLKLSGMLVIWARPALPVRLVMTCGCDASSALGKST